MSDKIIPKPTSEESDEALVDALFAKRESYDLTPDNSKFFLSEGGLVSMELSVPNKEKEFFERVIIIRTFPISNPDEFLSVREPDARDSEKGDEIGIIRALDIFPEETVKIIRDELDKRYFIPEEYDTTGDIKKRIEAETRDDISRITADYENARYGK